MANVVQAQCVTPPTCAQLGYTKTASECSGHTFLKCPFDMSVGYCDLGTSSTPVPDPAPTYNVGDSYVFNGAIIGRVIKVEESSYVVASVPTSKGSNTYSDYCAQLNGTQWTTPSESEIMKIYTIYEIELGYPRQIECPGKEGYYTYSSSGSCASKNDFYILMRSCTAKFLK